MYIIYIAVCFQQYEHSMNIACCVWRARFHFVWGTLRGVYSGHYCVYYTVLSVKISSIYVLTTFLISFLVN